MTNIPELLREFGKDPELLFRSLGLEIRQFAQPDSVISYIDASRLLEYCVAATGCEHFGLLVGERAGSSSLGISGFMMRSAPNVGTALHSLQNHIDLHDQGGVVTLGAENDTALFGYEVQLASAHAPEVVLDLSIAVACRIMRELCGNKWSPARVLFTRSKPKDPSPYQRFFQAPVHFGADRNGLIFASFWLQEKPAQADPLLFDYLRAQASDLQMQQKHDLLSDLRDFLDHSLRKGNCSVADSARYLGLHPRTLNRRLHDIGTSFRWELREVRNQVACELLAENRYKVTKISELLGYSDVTAFIKAFTKWTGMTPKRWQTLHAEQKPDKIGQE